MLTNVTLVEIVERDAEVNIYSASRVTHTAFHIPCIGYDRIVPKGLTASNQTLHKHSMRVSLPFYPLLYSPSSTLSISSSSLSYLNGGICNRGAGSSGIVIVLGNCDSDELLLQEM